MNTLKDTLATLNPEVRGMIETIMKSSEEIFKEDQVAPCAFYRDAAGHISVCEIAGDFNDETKPYVWAMIRMFRKTHPTVAFISEVWMSNPKPGDGIWEDGQCKVMPRDDPNHTECIMLNLWEGRRIVTFKNDITRNPDALGGWKVFYDSFFPAKCQVDGVTGAMMDGEVCAQEGN